MRARLGLVSGYPSLGNIIARGPLTATLLPFALVCGAKDEAVARASIFGLLVQSGVVVAPLSFDPRTAQAQDLAPRPLGVWLSRLRPLRPPGQRLYRLSPNPPMDTD